MASAGHIFSKVLRVLVMFWRSKGHKIITFLDDGIGGDKDYNVALNTSLYIKQNIVDFGYLLANEKCNWQPTLQMNWLGYYICMQSGKFFITEERISRLEIAIKSVLLKLQRSKLSIMHLFTGK